MCDQLTITTGYSIIDILNTHKEDHMETITLIGASMLLGWAITTVVYLIVERINGDL